MKTWLSAFVLTIALFVAIGSQAIAGLLDAPVSATYIDRTVNEVAADLSKQSGTGILVDPTAPVARFSIDLGKTTLGAALDQVCSLTGLFYGLIGGKAVVIASADPKGPYFMAISQTKLININNIPVKDLLNLMGKSQFLDYITIDETTNVVAVVAPLPIIQKIVETIKIYDQEPIQVSFELMYVDTSKVKMREFIPNWQWIGGKSTTGDLQRIQFEDSELGFMINNVWSGQFLANLTSNSSDDQLKILAKPNITVMNNQSATIFLGTNTYVPISTISGVAPALIQAIESGNKIMMRKIHVTDDNQIIIDIEADASEIIGKGTAGLPQINRRKVTTVLKVTDGETIIIGGLASSLDYTIRSKVPILGDIPIIGNLFRSSRKETHKQEITILITPKILRPESKLQPSTTVIEKAKQSADERTPILEGSKAPSPVENTKTPVNPDKIPAKD